MKRVIIIGAGPAGLTAAYELLKDKNDKFSVVILEETNDIGGISKTVKHNGNRMDIGGHRFFSKNEDIMNFWKELMPLQGSDSFDDKILGRKKDLSVGGPDPEKEDNVMLIRQRVSRIYSFGTFFDYPITMSFKTFKTMGFFRTMKAGFSYLGSCIHKRKEISLEDFYINRFGKVLYQMFFEKYTEKLWGRHPSQISADWGAQRVKGLSIKTILKDMFNKPFKKKKVENTETSLIEKFWYPKYGPGHLWEHLAYINQKLGAEIKFNHKVKFINVQENNVVSVTCENGEKVDGDIFISSMPMNDLIASFKGIEIPKNIKDISEGLSFRDFMTVGVLVDKLNLDNKTNIKTLGNIVPDCWIYIQEPSVKMLRIQIFNNWSPYLVKDCENKVWIGTEYTCKQNDKFWKMSDKEFCDFAINELVSMNLIKKENVLDCHREKIKKAYPAYFDTYKDIDKLVSFLNGIDNIYCIGRNGQHRYNNMDHSMLTAIETVKNIKNGTNNKDNIWNVNVEKQYHEMRNFNNEKMDIRK